MKKLLLILLCLPMIGFGQCISGDCENGYGKYITSDDIIYKGEWKDGKCHGLGRMTFPSGNKYVGEYKDDKKHGQGTMTWANGNIDEGKWKDDKMHGQGTMTFASGEKVVGEFREGSPWNITSYDKERKILSKWVNGELLEE